MLRFARSSVTTRPASRPTIRTQLLIGLVAVAVVPLLTFAGVAGARLLQSVDRDATTQLVAEATTVVERMDDYVERHRRGIAVLAADPSRVTGLVEHFAPRLPQFNLVLEGFLTLLVADSAGTIVAAYSRDSASNVSGAIGRKVNDRSYFRGPMASRTSFVSDAFRGRGLGTEPIVALSSAIPGARGQPVGVLEGSLNLNRFARFTHNTSTLNGARLIIVDRARRVVYAYNAPELTILGTTTGTRLGAALQANGGGSGALAYDDPDADGRMLTAVAVSRETGWRVIVAQPRSAAREAGLRHLRTILIGIALAAVLSIMLALRMARRVTRPIEQLSEQLRHFDGEAPHIDGIVAPADAPAEVEALLNEFAGMSVRVRETSGAQQASEARFRAIFDHAAIGIALHDDLGQILESNAAFQQIVGYSGDELRRMCAAELSPPEEATITRDPVRALQEDAVQRVTVEKHMLHRDGRAVLCALTLTRLQPGALPGEQGVIVGMVEDVTERRVMERELVWRANHDALTGLANRVCLHERVESVLARRHVDRSVAVLMLDLDEFKRINDSLGHPEGDRLLREVSQRLLSATRGCDTVARLGGDEFAILLDGVGTPVFADIIAERIMHMLKRPISLHGGEVVLSASIGIAYAEAGETVDEVIRNADTAMYQAKRAGKATYDTYTPAMHAEVADLLSTESDLRGAEEANELSAVYQIIVDIATGEPVGAECLMRWRRNGTENVPPEMFIPIAEQTGLIIPFGRWILHTACRAGATWQERAGRTTSDTPPFTMTVNLSGRQLHDANLVADVRAALDDSGFDPRCLVLEITESVVMRNADVGISRLEELRALGIRLAIDDFGTGYSSLSYLQRLPIDVLKIDKSFIDTVDDNARGAALVRTILRLAETMSLRCVAEGIETESQLHALREMGCAYGQGFLFARPASSEEVGERLLRRSASLASA